jgi:hypothetical protein
MHAMYLTSPIYIQTMSHISTITVVLQVLPQLGSLKSVRAIEQHVTNELYSRHKHLAT